MKSVATTQPPVRAASLPNVLTYLRILAVPAIVLCLLLIEGDGGRWWALAVYIAACITDWLDGYLARVWHQQTTLGRMLDPIADKLLVGTTLLMLAYDNTIDGPAVGAAAIILCREILVSGLREFLAELNVKVHVTRLAKWKTTLQMIALGILVAGPAGDKILPNVTNAGIFMLWVAALLSPRPASLLVLNEPETSLHSDLLRPAADLIGHAATQTQVIAVTHSPILIDALRRSARNAAAGLGTIELVKEFGETVVAGAQPLDEPPWHWPKR